MKITPILKIVFILFLFTLANTRLFAQINSISRDWKFKTGDSIEWASPNYNDSNWNDMKAGLWWAHAGYDYSGIAWYRKKIFISSDLKSAVKESGYLKLSLGQIQDADQTFLNGKLIGHTGSFSPFEGKWGVPRNYYVKSNQINWDSENTIAVRVYGPNNNGGMHTGPYFYEPYRITFKDYVKVVKSDIQPALSGNFKGYEYRILYRNSGIKNYCGELLFQVYDSANTIQHTEKQTITIKRNSDTLNLFTIYFDKPLTSIYRISAEFTESKTHIKLTKELTVSNITDASLPVLARPIPVIENLIKDVFIPAPFENQQIGGIVGERMNINLNKRLLEVNEKELLAGYQNRPGKQNWVGEHVGKYLDAASNTWRYTHDPSLKSQMDRILLVLLNTQKENGYLGTYTPENYWTNWDVWSHKYNLVGLLSYYKATGYLPALEAAESIGGLLCKTFGNQPEQLDIILSGTHVGMASSSILDPIVDLYQYTGNQKYLEFAKYIISSYDHPDGPEILKSLLKNGRVNQVANGKAYEMLSNLIGIIKLYKLTGQDELYSAVKIAWNDIVENRLYITGTASSYELFRDDHILPAGAGDHMGEGCVTTTWFQLNYQLFALTGELIYYDQMETSLYNHLLGAENLQTGCVSYYTPLQDKKPFSCEITCCLSSIPRGISMIPLINYGNKSGIPTILLQESTDIKDTVISQANQIIPIKIIAESTFPDSGKVEYTFYPEFQAVFSVCFRVPLWTKEFSAEIENELYEGTPGTFMTIKREWKPGDKLRIKFDIPVIYIPGEKSYPNKVALKRGPQILAIDQSLNRNIFLDSLVLDINDSVDYLLQNMKMQTPINWIGKQFYNFYSENESREQKKIVFVPFSDASQTGEKSVVWINRNIK